MGRSAIRYGIYCFLSVFFIFCLFSDSTAQQDAAYTIAVVPSYPPVATYTQWTPFIARLSKETGFKFRLKVYEKMSEFERDIWKGAPDFIFASPIQTVVAYLRNNYTPLVRGSKPVAIRLFVRDDSPIMTIAELSGKRVAFVGNKNVCSVYIRHMIGKEKDKLSYMSEYSGSSKNVIKSVLLGKNDAGAVFIPELEQESSDVQNSIRSIYDTPTFAPHPLSANPRVTKEARRAIAMAVLSIAGTKDGAELLRTVRMPSPVAADYKRDYKALEEIDVIGLTDWGN